MAKRNQTKQELTSTMTLEEKAYCQSTWRLLDELFPVDDLSLPRKQSVSEPTHKIASIGYAEEVSCDSIMASIAEAYDLPAYVTFDDVFNIGL